MTLVVWHNTWLCCCLQLAAPIGLLSFTYHDFGGWRLAFCLPAGTHLGGVCGWASHGLCAALVPNLVLSGSKAERIGTAPMDHCGVGEWETPSSCLCVCGRILGWAVNVRHVRPHSGTAPSPADHRPEGGGVSRSPDGLFAQQEREPIRGRPAVRGKRIYGGRPGQ